MSHVSVAVPTGAKSCTQPQSCPGNLENGCPTCPTFESLDKDGNGLISAVEAVESGFEWILGGRGQIDADEMEDIKAELNIC